MKFLAQAEQLCIRTPLIKLCAFKVNEEWGCYNYTEEQEQVFYTFDNTMNYIIGFVGFLGLVGNFLCTITLGRKEMRSNCFHQLCLGKVFYLFIHCFVYNLHSIYIVIDA